MSNWPTNTVDTTNISSDTNQLSEGRKLIKQNIDNTNAIINEFDLSSFSDQQILQYQNGKWTPINVSQTGVIAFAYIINDAIQLDPSGMLSTDSTGLILTTGTYFIQQISPGILGTSITLTVGSQVSNTQQEIQQGGGEPEHRAGTTSGYFTVDSSNNGNITMPNDVQYLIYKLS